MVKVVHVREEKFDLYIGRSCMEFKESIWANQFVMGVDGNRKEVCAKYKAHILASPELMARLHELQNKTIGCWCKRKKKPLLCHGDVLAELVAEYCK